MPSRERVAALIAMVEQGKYVEAIEAFYVEERFCYDPAQLRPAKPTSKA